MRDGEAVGVLHPDPHRRDVAGRRDEPLFERERTDAREQVAAVLVVGHFGAIRPDLQEQVVDVGVAPG